MIYEILANKWRPKSFNEVIGQEHILMTIKNSFDLGYLHNSYLLSGVSGIGKTTIARLIAKSLNCKLGMSYNFCNRCTHCVNIDTSSFIDVIEIDAASKTKVENIRDLLENVQYIPTHGRFKIFIIDEAHMLSRYSFNALLKTLEETPKHVKFILATTDYYKLPQTIISRCLQLHLKMIEFKKILSRIIYILNSENINYEKHAITEIVNFAYGNMRNAINLIDQAIAMSNKNINYEIVNMMLGLFEIDYSISILESISKKDGNLLISNIDKFESFGINWDRLLKEILILLHKLAMHSIAIKKIDTYNFPENILERLNLLSKNMTFNKIEKIYKCILFSKKYLKYAPDVRIGIDMVMLSLLQIK